VECGDGYGNVGNVTPGACCDPDAKVVCEGFGGFGKIMSIKSEY
jgi:hypothetical protein